jgi:myo-inositol-1(or 4)-monophosphatase
MAVASEQAAPASGYPKVAAPTTGPIPAAELLGVIEAAAKAGADVSSSSLCRLMFGVTLASW